MSDEIKHYGVKGMKWGVRRYQNKDGSRKPAGKKRERKDGSLKTKYVNAMDRANAKSAAGTAKRKAAIKAAPKNYKEAVKKHESKSKDGLTYKIPDAAVGVAAAMAYNSVMMKPAAMAGRAMFNSNTGALAGTLASTAASVDVGMKVYKRMNESR